MRETPARPQSTKFHGGTTKKEATIAPTSTMPQTRKVPRFVMGEEQPLNKVFSSLITLTSTFAQLNSVPRARESFFARVPTSAGGPGCHLQPWSDESKHQIQNPSTREAPKTKLRKPTAVGASSLEFLWKLELGIWS